MDNYLQLNQVEFERAQSEEPRKGKRKRRKQQAYQKRKRQRDAINRIQEQSSRMVR